MPARTLYAEQSCTIETNAGTKGNFVIQTASCETTIPVDDLLVLGKLGSAGRFQKEVSTCKSDLKIFLNQSGADASKGYGPDGTFLSTLTGEAFAGKVATISVSPNGFTMSGIVTSIGLDISKGSFGMCDLSFAGVGTPDYAGVPTTATGYTGDVYSYTAVPILTGVSLLGNASSTCPNSAKVSIDLPNEVISCLGGAIVGDQSTVANDNLMLVKPPIKGTITVEGTSAAEATGVEFLKDDGSSFLKVAISDGKLTSRSFNQNVGDVGANYNFTVEGLGVEIS